MLQPDVVTELLDKVGVGTGMHLALVRRLPVLHERDHFKDAAFERLKRALSAHLLLLLKFKHPRACKTFLHRELQRLDAPLVCDVFLGWRHAIRPCIAGILAGPA